MSLNPFSTSKRPNVDRPLKDFQLGGLGDFVEYPPFRSQEQKPLTTQLTPLFTEVSGGDNVTALGAFSRQIRRRQ